MGGMGSGRWTWHRKARTVEASRTLDIGLVTRGRTPAAGQSGTLTWSRGDTIAASVGYTVLSRAEVLILRLNYSWTPHAPGSAPQTVTLDIPLVSRSIPRGGRRWWGVCPLAVNGVRCRRRVGKLYLPPGHHLFGCRDCHQLTYGSRQDHDARVSRLARDPLALIRLADAPGPKPVAQLGLYLRALTLVQKRSERDLKRFEKPFGPSRPAK
jgi:hypothetical protein